MNPPTQKQMDESLNYPQTKEMLEIYKKTLKNILKSISPTLLIETLVEMKILKKDYITNEVSLKNTKNK